MLNFIHFLLREPVVADDLKFVALVKFKGKVFVGCGLGGLPLLLKQIVSSLGVLLHCFILTVVASIECVKCSNQKRVIQLIKFPSILRKQCLLPTTRAHKHLPLISLAILLIFDPNWITINIK